MGKSLSIILPSYKGASIIRENLPPFIAFLKSSGYDFEIIVVDDGSNDNGKTEAVAKELGCKFLQNPRNLGKGAAVKLGMLNAKGDIRIFTDVDIPFQYESINRFYYYLDHKEFDIVVGDRTLEDSDYFDGIPKRRRIGSLVFSFLVGTFVTSGLFDTQCGLKGFRGEIAQDIFSKTRINSFAFDVEVLYIALKRNYDIKRLPVSLRNHGASTVSLLKHSLKMTVDILKLKINHLKGYYRK